MKVLIDTCVVLDFLFGKEPYGSAALKVFESIGREEMAGYITAKEATDIYYIHRRYSHSAETTRKALQKLLSILGVLDSTAEDVLLAVGKDGGDFEDQVMGATAIRNKMDAIITRNEKDFLGEGVKIINPADFTLAEA